MNDNISHQQTNDSLRRFEARRISVHFEGVKAVDSVDLVLRHGEILGLIGPNGAGKTTLVNLMTCALKPKSGSLFLDNVNVTGWAPHRLARYGVGRTFQNVRLFRRLSVLENIETGAVGVGLSRKEARERSLELLDWMHMSKYSQTRADSLPYGMERRLGVMRALAMKPCYLFLDEPAAGLDEQEGDELVQYIFEIRNRYSCAILVIEHDMRFVMQLCDRIHVLDYGRTISVGTPKEVQSDPLVVAAYLGTDQ